MPRKRSLAGLLALLGVAASAPAAPPPAEPTSSESPSYESNGPPPADAEACAALQALDYAEAVGATVRFTAAADVAARADVPAYCRVAGTIAPAVGFEVRLPQLAWNGKLLVTGCGNLCGVIEQPGLEDALARGYAAATSDLGHQGDPSDARWARDNPAAEADFGHRATHVTTRLAKALVAAYYGAAAEYAFFRGCSTGGRQGLVAAERYPDDFDGIIAGAPFNQALAVPHMAWALAANTGPDGTPLLGRPEFARLAAGALSACDAGDGLRDGVIGDPEGCRFDPAVLACTEQRSRDCLQPAQMAAAARIYAGPRDSAGRPLAAHYPAGAPVGSEPDWAAQLLPAAPGQPAYFGFIVQNWLRHLAFEPDPQEPGPLRFDFDRDPARLAATSRVTGFRPELARYRDRGGRLILYHGWADESLMPGHTLDYWRAASARLGGEAALAGVARLYMVPGMRHCGTGPGATEIDFLAALERWVEDDEPPDALLAARVSDAVPTSQRQPRFPLAPDKVLFTRPLFPYPGVAVWNGRGDPADAGSFVRRVPAVVPGTVAAPRPARAPAD